LVRPYQTGIPPVRLLALVWAHNSDLLLLYFYFTTFPRAWKYLLFRADFRPYGYTGWAVFSV
jgi:hypothetical protein